MVRLKDQKILSAALYVQQNSAGLEQAAATRCHCKALNGNVQTLIGSFQTQTVLTCKQLEAE